MKEGRTNGRKQRAADGRTEGRTKDPIQRGRPAGRRTGRKTEKGKRQIQSEKRKKEGRSREDRK